MVFSLWFSLAQIRRWGYVCWLLPVEVRHEPSKNAITLVETQYEQVLLTNPIAVSSIPSMAHKNLAVVTDGFLAVWPAISVSPTPFHHRPQPRASFTFIVGSYVYGTLITGPWKTHNKLCSLFGVFRPKLAADRSWRSPKHSNKMSCIEQHVQTLFCGHIVFGRCRASANITG